MLELSLCPALPAPPALLPSPHVDGIARPLGPRTGAEPRAEPECAAAWLAPAAGEGSAAPGVRPGVPRGVPLGVAPREAEPRRGVPFRLPAREGVKPYDARSSLS